MKATVEKETKQKYIVEDYGGEVLFDELKDARKYLKDMGKGRSARITAQTVETIVIKTEQIIQTL